MAEYTHEELMAKVLEVLATKDKMKNKEKNFTDEIVCMVYCSYGAMILLMAAKEKCRRVYGREHKESDLCDRS